MFIVRSALNPALILCTNGEWLPASMVGPGGRAAKTYKTQRSAARVRDGKVIVEAVAS